MTHDNLTQELARVFHRLDLHYGAEWAIRWAKVDLQEVLAEWHQELQAFNGSAQYVAAVMDGAMRELPLRPPNLPQFRVLCEQARERLRQPAARGPELPVRGPTPQERAALQQLRDRIASGGLFAKPSSDWAFTLVAKHERGEPVSYAGLRMARDVVESETRKHAVRATPYAPPAPQVPGLEPPHLELPPLPQE